MKGPAACARLGLTFIQNPLLDRWTLYSGCSVVVELWAVWLCSGMGLVRSWWCVAVVGIVGKVESVRVGGANQIDTARRSQIKRV